MVGFTEATPRRGARRRWAARAWSTPSTISAGHTRGSRADRHARRRARGAPVPRCRRRPRHLLGRQAARRDRRPGSSSGGPTSSRGSPAPAPARVACRQGHARRARGRRALCARIRIAFQRSGCCAFRGRRAYTGGAARRFTAEPSSRPSPRAGGGAAAPRRVESFAARSRRSSRRAAARRLPGDRHRARRQGLLDCRTLTDDEVEEAAEAVRDMPHGRHRRPHRPRQDLARPCADREGHRPTARGAGRGISIDLGYAPLELPDGRRLSVVDVPGHERFVRNMVAGATGIDLFLLVDRRGRRGPSANARAPRHHPPPRDRARRRRDHEGRRGGRGDRELAVDEARELVPGAPVVVTSAKTGDGLDELRAALE